MNIGKTANWIGNTNCKTHNEEFQNTAIVDFLNELSVTEKNKIVKKGEAK